MAISVDVAGNEYLAMTLDMGINIPSRLYVAIVAPVDDFTGYLKRVLEQSLLFTVLVVILDIFRLV